jgi:hypothetical protein
VLATAVAVVSHGDVAIHKRKAGRGMERRGRREGGRWREGGRREIRRERGRGRKRESLKLNEERRHDEV